MLKGRNALLDMKILWFISWDNASTTQDSQDRALGAGIILSPHLFKAFCQGILTFPFLLQQHH